MTPVLLLLLYSASCFGLKCNCKSSGTLSRTYFRIQTDAFNRRDTFETLAGSETGCNHKDECETKQAVSGYTPRCVKVTGHYTRFGLNGTGTFYDCQLENQCYDRTLADSGTTRGKLTYCFCGTNKCNSATILKSICVIILIIVVCLE